MHTRCAPFITIAADIGKHARLGSYLLSSIDWAKSMLLFDPKVDIG
jgi:hypothetical protein